LFLNDFKCWKVEKGHQQNYAGSTWLASYFTKQENLTVGMSAPPTAIKISSLRVSTALI